MIQIRPEQIRVFDAKTAERFEDEMWEHLQDFAPRLCELTKENGVREVIRLGIQNAEAYGFTHRGPVRFFIELMFSFGCHFDTDPQHHWVRRSLASKDNDQTYRAEQLFEDYQEFAEKCMGEKNTILMTAIKQISVVDPDSLVTGGGETQKEIAAAIERIYPQRTMAIGQDAVDKLIVSAIATAESYGARAKVSQVISSGLAVLVGHRYDDDEIYRWIGRTLNPQSKVDPDQKFRTLFGKVKVYLGEVVNYWERQ